MNSPSILDLDQFAGTRPRSLLPPGRCISPIPQIVLQRSPGVPYRGFFSADICLIANNFQVSPLARKALGSLLGGAGGLLVQLLDCGQTEMVAQRPRSGFSMSYAAIRVLWQNRHRCTPGDMMMPREKCDWREFNCIVPRRARGPSRSSIMEETKVGLHSWRMESHCYSRSIRTNREGFP